MLFFSGLAVACAAAPAVQPLQLSSVVANSATTLQASVSDPGGNLVSATFYFSGPAVRDSSNLDAIAWPGAQLIGTVNLSGSQASPQITWQPTQPGTYTISVYIADQTTTSVQSGTIECVADRLVVPPVTVASGANTMYLDPGEIVTTENDTSTNVVVQSGGNLTFWSGGRVDLKPGFHATSGSFFWAAVDHNMDGYSDVEESTCTSGDGIPDAWKLDHGLSITTNYSNQPSIMAAFQASHTANGAIIKTAPVIGQLVLRTPTSGNYGVNTQTWAISGL
jgi:hypothetical protein